MRLLATDREHQNYFLGDFMTFDTALTALKPAAIVLAFTLAVTTAPAVAADRLDEGDTAPAWTGVDLISGDTVEFPAVLDDRPALILFWATWCPYCKAFMPYAEGIQADYADRGLQVVTFNHKERGAGDAAAYAKSLGFPMIAIADADSIGDLYDVDFIPGLMVVDGDAKIVYRRKSTNLPAGKTVAEQWDSEVRAVLDGLL